MFQVNSPQSSGGLLGNLCWPGWREVIIGRYVEETVDVDSERVRSLPSEAECELFEEEFGRFCSFANDLGVGALPATGHTVAFYLLDLLLNGVSMDEIAAAAAAIKHAHEMARRYLDLAPIQAALEFAIKEPR